MAITPVSIPAILPTPGNSTRPVAAEGGDFGSSLSALLESVESTNTEANTAVLAMTDGTGDVHTAMLALHKAEVAMQMTVQVRNKLVQAYQDLMRMPI